MYKLILLAGLCAVIAQLDAAPRKLVCTYQKTSSSISANLFDIMESINPHLCTHLIYTSVKPSPVKVIPSPSDNIKFQDFNKLKSSNPNLKTLLEVDLTDLNTNNIFIQGNRALFIQSVIDILMHERFDGVNIVWEFKVGVSQPSDKQSFTLLMKELKVALSTLPLTVGPQLLTASVSAVKLQIDQSYEVPRLVKLVDFLNVITFDRDRTVVPPLVGPAPFPNAEFSMQYWFSEGAPKEKLNMGIASYGFDTNPSANPSIIAKYEECARPPPPTTISVDSDETIVAKAKYIVNAEFGGAFVKSLDLDDFNGNFCGQGKYPVIGLIKSII
ncbi:acidic mammalian chitinase-like [Festucalex cinctus]